MIVGIFVLILLLPSLVFAVTPDISDLSGKSVEELSVIHSNEANALHDDENLEYFGSTKYYEKQQQLSEEFGVALEAEWRAHEAKCNTIHDFNDKLACVQEPYEHRAAQEFDQAMKAVYIEEITKIRVLALRAGTVKPVTPTRSGGISGPGFNTNPDRGRDEFGRINPSMGGYLGYAYVVRSDGTKVIPGKELYLRVDDKVITGKESKVNIIFGNAGRMNLGPNTELRVGSALLDQYYLAKGTLLSKLHWVEKQKFDINTPNAFISMTGTEFIVDYNETTNTTAVFLNEGTLEVSSATQVMNLTAGYSCQINPDGTIVSNQLTSEDWTARGSDFLDEEQILLAYKIYAWASFAVMIISAIISILVMNRVKAKSQKTGKNRKDLGRLSLVLGILGIIAVLFPLVGYPISITSTTLARIQKLRRPTTMAKTGFVLGCVGVVLNVAACSYLLVLTF